MDKPTKLQLTTTEGHSFVVPNDLISYGFINFIIQDGVQNYKIFRPTNYLPYTTVNEAYKYLHNPSEETKKAVWKAREASRKQVVIELTKYFLKATNDLAKNRAWEAEFNGETGVIGQTNSKLHWREGTLKPTPAKPA